VLFTVLAALPVGEIGWMIGYVVFGEAAAVAVGLTVAHGRALLPLGSAPLLIRRFQPDRYVPIDVASSQVCSSPRTSHSESRRSWHGSPVDRL